MTIPSAGEDEEQLNLSYVANRMAKVKYTKNTKCWEDVEQPDVTHCWWECKIVQPLCKTVW